MLKTTPNLANEDRIKYSTVLRKKKVHDPITRISPIGFWILITIYYQFMLCIKRMNTFGLCINTDVMNVFLSLPRRELYLSHTYAVQMFTQMLIVKLSTVTYGLLLSNIIPL